MLIQRPGGQPRPAHDQYRDDHAEPISSTPTSANNSAAAGTVVTPQQADLGLTKTVDDSTPNVGDTITYTITLTNSGPDEATGVQALDPLSAGLSFVSDTTSQGTYDPSTGLWSVGMVAVGSPQTLLIRATVDSPIPRDQHGRRLRPPQTSS